MADLIDVRRNDGIRLANILFELGIDAREPFVENFGGARIERGKDPIMGFTGRLPIRGPIQGTAAIRRRAREDYL